MGQERGIGRDDHDAAALLVVERDRPAISGQGGTDGHAIDRQPLDPTEVRQGQHAEVIARRAGPDPGRAGSAGSAGEPWPAARFHRPGGVADAGLQLEPDHPHARPDDPARDRAAGGIAGSVERPPDIIRLDLDRPRRIQVAVVALGHDRHQGIGQARLGNLLDEGRDRGVVDPADRHR